ncbi:MAG: helix-turn-helix domain-containing protein, partial [Acutalibacteraceae bacterium]|nr:helix-turn-helix domain-containing protein [Acutalibacteraceae bacterium]
MDFGDKLKQYRLNEGLSQEQLAEKIGVSRQAITKWETKRGLPDVENMIILAEIFKLTLDELVLEEVKKQEEKPVVFESETVYDIDTQKHFDVNLGGARRITLKTGVDEKIHIRLSSETLSDIASLFKV